ncbi:MAG: protein-L-isoaspartate O-methyltransferase [Gammaproteobacteria bacterium]|nr:protein-L-isoaspartate O-methyltransferase [Gammaproteobacteria bacterium]
MTSQRTRDRLVNTLRDMGINNELILSVMATTPRHLFIDEALSSRAYENKSLPIGHGQTISQPYIVAKMTELLLGQCFDEMSSEDIDAFKANKSLSAQYKIPKALEVGTGSGYQTGVLSPFVKNIYTVERILPLLNQAKEKFRQLKLNNILTHHSDGCWGWKERAPFDAIIVTAAPCEMQEALLEQLSDNGRLVVPVGPNGKQKLHYYEKRNGEIEHRIIEDVSFVPLISGQLNYN